MRMRYLCPEDLPDDLSDLRQIAVAAGHGHGHLGVGQGPNPWYTLEDNVRPGYDIHFVQTFNPDVVDALIKRLQDAEENERYWRDSAEHWRELACKNLREGDE